MNLSFPESSQEKMEHRYALFNDPGPTARLPIRRRRIEFNNPALHRTADAAGEIAGRWVTPVSTE